MRVVVKLPASDADLIAQLRSLPEVQHREESHFGAQDVVVFIVDLAVTAKAIASTTKSISDTAKSVHDAAQTITSIFRKATKRNRDNLEADFTVTRSDGQALIRPEMDEDEVDNAVKLMEDDVARNT